jgi:DNA-binding winged helix-turn-helix (wHTH) protein
MSSEGKHRDATKPAVRAYALFDWIVPEVRPHLDEPMLVIHGPRGFGKSECAAVLSGLLAVAPDDFVSGRAPEALDALHRWEREAGELETPRWVMMEDIDDFLSEVPHPTTSREERLLALDGMLSTTQASEKLRLVVTLTRHPANLVEPHHISSAFLTRARRITLAETPRSVWEKQVEGALRRMPREIATAAASAGLAGQVMELSDSHPALMLAALDGIAMLADRSPDESPLTAEYLELTVRSAMLHQGTPPIRRQLLRFLKSDDEVSTRVIQKLRVQLNAGGNQPFELTPSEAELLYEAGLVRPVVHRIGQFRLPRGVIRELLIDTVDPSLAVIQPRVLFRGSTVSANKGEVVCTAPDGVRRRATLTPNSWTIVSTLRDAGGQVVSLAELKEALERKGGRALSEKGVTTAVNRLLVDLAGLTPANLRLVENVRGSGYRMAVDKFEIESTAT